ncbi:hypothetical protein [Methanococcus sp. CF]
MDLKEAKKMFEVNHPEEFIILAIGGNNPNRENPRWMAASCVWRGFKSALILTGQLTGINTDCQKR